MDNSLVLRKVVPAVAVAGSVGMWRAVTPKWDPAAIADAEARVLGNVRTLLTHRFIQAGQHQLHTVILGEGPPLVLLHGHSGGVGVWIHNLDALARHFRVYAVDWLGWGRSDRPYFTGRTAESARQWWLNSLEDWREAVGLSEFVLVGHSLGGWIAAEYAMAHPGHIRNLVLINAAGIMDEVDPFKAMFYYISPQRMVQSVGPLGPRLVAYGFSDQAANCPSDGGALLDYYFLLASAPLGGQLAFERILTPRHWVLPLLPRAEQLRVPTTLIWGEQDDLIRVHHAIRLHEILPMSRIALFPRSLHWPHSDDPQRFETEILAAVA